ncbi:hypothetical protein ABRZ24_01085 [Brenneria populi]|uniref:Uncharacterized protein n=1 Tax=Brenneria populi TaxID=1505588 RepID=A0ABU6JKK6_9GAMM|nr:hypothetical protein [Brenneria populi Li et al. 2015]
MNYGLQANLMIKKLFFIQVSGMDAIMDWSGVDGKSFVHHPFSDAECLVNQVCAVTDFGLTVKRFSLLL